MSSTEPQEIGETAQLQLARTSWPAWRVLELAGGLIGGTLAVVVFLHSEARVSDETEYGFAPANPMLLLTAIWLLSAFVAALVAATAPARIQAKGFVAIACAAAGFLGVALTAATTSPDWGDPVTLSLAWALAAFPLIAAAVQLRGGASGRPRCHPSARRLIAPALAVAGTAAALALALLLGARGEMWGEGFAWVNPMRLIAAAWGVAAALGFMGTMFFSRGRPTAGSVSSIGAALTGFGVVLMAALYTDLPEYMARHSSWPADPTRAWPLIVLWCLAAAPLMLAGALGLTRLTRRSSRLAEAQRKDGA